MSDNKNWIEEAKEHFRKIPQEGLVYEDNDENSGMSKDINIKLKNKIKQELTNEDLILNTQGNKWAKQGHKKLQNYIWYNAYYKNFGKDYPIVLNVSIDQNGLNFSIDIYESRLPDDELQKKLLNILKEVIENECVDTDTQWNEKDDYGYFGIEEFDEKKLKKIVNCYNRIVCSVNRKIFDEMIGKYNFIEVSSTHCQINSNDDHYKIRKNVKTLVDDFLEDPNEEKFKNFWNKKTINSAQQASNATNLLNKVTITQLPTQIDNLIKLDPNDEKIIEKIKNQITGAKNSALEFYYYYRMNKDDFPLINGGIENAIEIIDKNCIKLEGDSLFQKMIYLKEKMRDGSLEKFYLLDQFLNLIDKIKYKDIKLEKSLNKELYQLAYLFTFFRKRKISNSNFFDELLEKTKNIILYGAPGTGKTFTSKKNIERILEANINDKIEEKRFEIIQFHPSYSYEDFMEGLKPVNINNNLVLKLESGEFMNFCHIASKYADDYRKATEYEKMKWAFFFLVDEINRAELSRVFGELMYALEKDKRGEQIKTQYAYLKKDDDAYFSVPPNLYFIGTMNDVDRSIDSFDIALRRRFLWYRMDCDYNVIYDEFEGYENIGELNNNDVPQSGYVRACYDLNMFITKKSSSTLGLGKIYEVGHSYFFNLEDYMGGSKKIEQKHLKELFDFNIEPLLREYTRSEFPEEEIDQHIKTAKQKFKLAVNDTNS